MEEDDQAGDSWLSNQTGAGATVSPFTINNEVFRFFEDFPLGGDRPTAHPFSVTSLSELFRPHEVNFDHERHTMTAYCCSPRQRPSFSPWVALFGHIGCSAPGPLCCFALFFCLLQFVFCKTGSPGWRCSLSPNREDDGGGNSAEEEKKNIVAGNLLLLGVLVPQYTLLTNSTPHHNNTSKRDVPHSLTRKREREKKNLLHNRCSFDTLASLDPHPSVFCPHTFMPLKKRTKHEQTHTPTHTH